MTPSTIAPFRHTPGPLHTGAKGEQIIYEANGWPIADTKTFHGRHLEGVATKNAALLAAAYTSYDKQCGTNAIQCAEGDLLGDSLNVLEATRATLSACLSHMTGNQRHMAEIQIRAIGSLLVKVGR